MERHEAIVAGAGGAGLAAAAMLRKRGFETVLLERTDAVGARWRKRYEGLRLNTMRMLSTLPGYHMPRRYGRYPRREDFIAYLEDYTAHHGLEPRFGTELQRVDRAGEDGLWHVETSRGSLLARHVVVATGYDAVPRLPEWAEGNGYGGELIHAAEYRSAKPYAGREVLIVGPGNTGIDVAGFLIDAGARVSVSMRRPPNVYPRDLLGFPLQLTGLPLEKLPARLGDAVGFATQRLCFGDLSRHGLPRSRDGFQTRFRRELITPAVDDGFVAALKAGRTKIVAEVERLEGEEVVLVDGARLRPDAIICATGYERGLEPIAGHLGVLEPNGLPTHHAAPENPAAPRLYFAGFFGAPAGQIRLCPIHARRIARAAARDRTSASAS